MDLKSTDTRYGKVAILIHWASAVAVVLAFAAGAVTAGTEPAPLGPLVAHIALGVSVLVLTLLRIVWWLVADRHPPPAVDQSRWQQISAGAVHWLLYAVLILMGTSGIMTLLLSGAIPALVAGGPVPDFSTVLPRIAHGAMSKLLLALFVGHVGAALYHQFVRRDHLLARMGIGRA
ncbi:MAG: cytochrome b/b6 domain-containing protein [Devosia nanyangense]|uniref:Cytochrome b/b6 domain-containing protein n=1 Tax=Devosia nanyangense TaxID=1228055 RepID=A0A933L0N2_9HYPH|nr:cytochrome b/b6 domain-containing protein [Devosia nanyangense]